MAINKNLKKNMHSVFKQISYPWVWTGNLENSQMWVERNHYSGSRYHISMVLNTPFKFYNKHFECLLEKVGKNPFFNFQTAWQTVVPSLRRNSHLLLRRIIFVYLLTFDKKDACLKRPYFVICDIEKRTINFSYLCASLLQLLLSYLMSRFLYAWYHRQQGHVW